MSENEAIHVEFQWCTDVGLFRFARNEAFMMTRDCVILMIVIPVCAGMAIILWKLTQFNEHSHIFQVY